MKKFLFSVASSVLVVSAPFMASAAEYTWLGNNLTNVFNAGTNWTGVPPDNTNNTDLFFGTSGIAGYNLYNDIGSLRIRNWIFTREATQAYTIEPGNVINVQNQGWFINNSTVTHVIENDLNFLDTNVNFDTFAGDLEWAGWSARAGSSLTLNKMGQGSLLLRNGDHTGSISTLTILGGELVLDAGSALVLDTSVNVTMSSVSHQGFQGGGGGTLKILGSDSWEVTLELGNFSVNQAYYGNPLGNAAHLVVDASGGQKTTVSFANFTSTSESSTVNIRLIGDAHVEAGSFTNLTNGVHRYVTVTSGGMTGFAAYDSGEIVRNTTFTAFPASGFNGTTNYSLSGNITLGGNAHGLNSITIQGAGTLTSANPGTWNFSPWALLMEEGVGDYHIDTRFGALGSQFVIHQHSTDGILYLNAGLGSATFSNNSRLYKTGPGTVVVTDQLAASDGLGHLNIGEGLLVNHGSIGTAVYVHVLSNGTLAGSGSIGGKLYDVTNTRYTITNVRSGGVLDGTNATAKALDITGTLLLDKGSVFRMELAGGSYDSLTVTNVTPASTILTILGALQLQLNYVPSASAKIVLLSWQGGLRSGEFTEINGNLFYGDDDDLFILTYNGNDYEFRLVYDDTAGEIYINSTMIPEPATVMLLMGIVSLAFVSWRRYRK